MYEPVPASLWKQFISDYAKWGVTGSRIVLGVMIFMSAVPLFSLAWAAFTWVLQREDDRKTKDFQTYHKLIAELVDPGEPGKSMYLDRQIAIVFELRRFKSYHLVTKRILTGMREAWSIPFPRLDQEIELTLAAIEQTKE